MRGTKLKNPRKDASQPRKVAKPAGHKKGSEGNYTPKRKKDIRDLSAPEPNFHGVYCEYMTRDGMVFLHGPMSAEGPQYVLCSSPQELWNALQQLALEPGALDPAARMPRGTEALDWDERQMNMLVVRYKEKKEAAVVFCPAGPALQKLKKKMTLEELGLTGD